MEPVWHIVPIYVLYSCRLLPTYIIHSYHIHHLCTYLFM